MNDQELIARAREVGLELRRRPGDLDRLAGTLLRELAARLEWHAADAAQAAAAKPPPV
ncbi:MAG TPA: hypothetical protein VGL33_30640 [Streptosporangiaceae bacterium]|jgi:hypothetical protein